MVLLILLFQAKDITWHCRYKFDLLDSQINYFCKFKLKYQANKREHVAGMQQVGILKQGLPQNLLDASSRRMKKKDHLQIYIKSAYEWNITVGTTQ